MGAIGELIYLGGVLYASDGGSVSLTELPTVNDGFVVGLTVPDATNTGVTGEPRTLYTGPATFVGTDDPANPLKLHHLNVDRLLTWGGGFVDFHNVMFTAGGGTFDTGLINCRANVTGRVTVHRSTFASADPSHYLNAMIGHHYTVERCDVSRFVDAFGVYNQYGPRADVFIRGNYVHDGARFTAATTGIVHPSDTKTHNDFVQLQSGEGLWVEGNAVHGYLQYYASSLSTLGYTQTPGATPVGVLRYLDQGVLTQQNVAVGGVYYGGDYHVTNNWFWGTTQTIRPATRGTGGTPYDVEVLDNTWMDMPFDWGGTLHYYPMRSTSNTTFNGTSYPTTGGTADTFGNKYDTGTDVLEAYRGQPVTIRSDLGG